VFYSTPKYLNYFETFTNEEKKEAVADDEGGQKGKAAVNLEEVEFSDRSGKDDREPQNNMDIYKSSKDARI